MEKGEIMNKKQNFDNILKELEQIADDLRSGKLGLEESISSYKRGMELSRVADKQLVEAEVIFNTVGQNSNEFEAKVTAILHKAKYALLDEHSNGKSNFTFIIDNLKDELTGLTRDYEVKK
jgi:exodeoxyribonuclease VII small subunit